MSLEGILSLPSSEFMKFCDVLSKTKGLNIITKLSFSALECLSFSQPDEMRYRFVKERVKTCKEMFNFVNFFELLGSFYVKGVSSSPESISNICICFAKAMSSIATFHNWRRNPDASKDIAQKSIFDWLLRQDVAWKRIEGVTLIAGFSIPVICKALNGRLKWDGHLGYTAGKIVVVFASKLIGHWEIKPNTKLEKPLAWIQFNPAVHKSTTGYYFKALFIICDLGVNLFGYYLATRK